MTTLAVDVRGAMAAAQRMQVLPSRVVAELRTEVERQAIALQAHIVENKLSGQVLHVRSGTGRRSITYEVVETPTDIRARVGTALRYMLAHEYGMTIQIPEIVPVHKKALRWVTKGGAVVFARRARAHTVVLPERSFLRSGLRDRAQAFIAGIRAACGRALTVRG